MVSERVEVEATSPLNQSDTEVPVPEQIRDSKFDPFRSSSDLLQQHNMSGKVYNNLLVIHFSENRSIVSIVPQLVMRYSGVAVPTLEKICDSDRTFFPSSYHSFLRSDGVVRSIEVWKGYQVAISTIILEIEVQNIAPYEYLRKVSVNEKFFNVDEMSNEIDCDDVQRDEVPGVQSIIALILGLLVHIKCELEIFSSAREVFDGMCEKQFNMDDANRGSDCDVISVKYDMSSNFDLLIEVILVYISINEVLVVFDLGGLSDLLKLKKKSLSVKQRNYSKLRTTERTVVQTEVQSQRCCRKVEANYYNSCFFFLMHSECLSDHILFNLQLLGTNHSSWSIFIMMKLEMKNEFHLRIFKETECCSGSLVVMRTTTSVEHEETNFCSDSLAVMGTTIFVEHEEADDCGHSLIVMRTTTSLEHERPHDQCDRSMIENRSLSTVLVDSLLVGASCTSLSRSMRRFSSHLSHLIGKVSTVLVNLFLIASNFRSWIGSMTIALQIRIKGRIRKCSTEIRTAVQAPVSNQVEKIKKSMTKSSILTVNARILERITVKH